MQIPTFLYYSTKDGKRHVLNRINSIRLMIPPLRNLMNELKIFYDCKIENFKKLKFNKEKLTNIFGSVISK